MRCYVQEGEAQRVEVVQGTSLNLVLQTLDRKRGWRVVIQGRELWCTGGNGPYMFV